MFFFFMISDFKVTIYISFFIERSNSDAGFWYSKSQIPVGVKMTASDLSPELANTYIYLYLFILMEADRRQT